MATPIRKRMLLPPVGYMLLAVCWIGIMPVLLPAQQRTWQWGHAFGGAFGDDEISDMEVDDSGNVYLIGVVGAGLELEDSLYQPIGEEDILLISYDCQGHLRWFEIMGKKEKDGDGPADFFQLEVGNNKLYVTVIAGSNGSSQSYFYVGDTIIKRAPGVFNMLMRYDLDGTFEWINVLGSEVSGKSWSSTIRHLTFHQNKVIVLVTSWEDSLEIDSGITINSGFTALWFDTTGIYSNKQINLSPTYTDNTFSSLIFTAGFEFTQGGEMVLGGYCMDSFQIAGQPRPAGAFVASFSPQGQLQWLEGSSGSAWTRILDIAVGDGTILCSGFGVRGDTLFGIRLPNPNNLGNAAFTATLSLNGKNPRVLFPKSITAISRAPNCDIKSNNLLAAHWDLAGTTIIGQDTFDFVGASSKPVVLLMDSMLRITDYVVTNTQGLDFNDAGPIRMMGSSLYISGTFASTIYLGTTDTLYKQGGGPQDIFIARYGVATCVDTTVTGTEKELPLQARGTLAVWPNPAGTQLQVAWQPTGDGYTLSLYTLRGQQVYRQRCSGTSPCRVRVSHLPRGMYYLSVQRTHGYRQGRLIVVQ